MDKLSESEFNTLIDGHQVLEKDRHGAKVLLTDGDKIIKVFRLKRHLSSALISPYAQRFKNNAEQLNQLGIITVEVERIAYCPALKKHLLIYPLINGHTLRDLLQQQYSALLVEQLAGFIARLHEKGVYFRSLHLGNVLQTKEKELALIDIADLSIASKPLSIKKRIRNFTHLLRYPQDKKHLVEYGLDNFFACYLEQANKPSLSLDHLLSAVH